MPAMYSDTRRAKSDHVFFGQDDEEAASSFSVDETSRKAKDSKSKVCRTAFRHDIFIYIFGRFMPSVFRGIDPPCAFCVLSCLFYVMLPLVLPVLNFWPPFVQDDKADSKSCGKDTKKSRQRSGKKKSGLDTKVHHVAA